MAFLLTKIMRIKVLIAQVQDVRYLKVPKEEVSYLEGVVFLGWMGYFIHIHFHIISIKYLNRYALTFLDHVLGNFTMETFSHRVKVQNNAISVLLNSSLTNTVHKACFGCHQKLYSCYWFGKPDTLFIKVL